MLFCCQRGEISVVSLLELDKYLSDIDLEKLGSSMIKLRINDVDDSNIADLANILSKYENLVGRISLDLTFCVALTEIKDDAKKNNAIVFFCFYNNSFLKNYYCK